MPSNHRLHGDMNPFICMTYCQLSSHLHQLRRTILYTACMHVNNLYFLLLLIGLVTACSWGNRKHNLYRLQMHEHPHPRGPIVVNIVSGSILYTCTGGWTLYVESSDCGSMGFSGLVLTNQITTCCTAIL